MSRSPKRILVLYWHHESLDRMRVGIRQHLGVLESSDLPHQLFYYNTFEEGPPDWLRHLEFDAVLLHNTFLCMRWANFFYHWKQHHDWLADLTCPKLAMPQDEYDHAHVLDEWLAQIGVDVIISNFTDPAIHRVLYPIMHSRARFAFALTGYLDDTLVELYKDRVRPIKDRPLDVVYRASHLPYWFGSHGQVKWQVGHAVDKRARQRGMKSNISTHSPDVILGYKWLDFLASSRAITGCEGGSSVIDRRGERKAQIEDMLRRQPGLSFDDISRFMPAGWNEPRMPLIGPRHLEAAMTRTCQILVDGTFCDVLQSGRHFIPIKPDYSNLDEVLDRLQDHASVQKMVDLSFDELCRSGRFSRKVLARTIEDAIDAIGRGPSSLARLKGTMLWNMRHRAGPKANDSIDLKISDDELSGLGQPYLAEPQCPPDLMELAHPPPRMAAMTQLSFVEAPPLRAADGVVFLDYGGRPAVRWDSWVKALSPLLSVWRVSCWMSPRETSTAVFTEEHWTDLHVGAPDRDALSRALNEALTAHGLSRPALVTDEVEALDFLRSRTAATAVVVAPPGLPDAPLRSLLASADIVVSPNAATAAEFNGVHLPALDGLDALMAGARGGPLQARADEAVAFVRGAIDETLDFDLLEQLCERLPDWSFWFSGPLVDPGPAWLRLVARGNVRYIGDRRDDWKWLAWRASVGLQPRRASSATSFNDAVEMLACGLPLVTSLPVEEGPAVKASGPAEVAQALESGRRLRHDRAALDARLAFVETLDAGTALRNLGNRLMRPSPRVSAERLEVVLLTAGRDHDTSGWASNSRHRITTATVTDDPQLEACDAVVVHPSAAVDFPNRLSDAWRRALVTFGGARLACLSGDIARTHRALRSHGIHGLITHPQPVDAAVAPSFDFLIALEAAPRNAAPSLPVAGAARPTLLSYRPEFAPISIEVREEVAAVVGAVERAGQARGLAVDLRPRTEREEPSTLLSSSRAILVVQTRLNIFDGRGNLRDTIRGSLNRAPALTYEQVVEQFRDGVVRNVWQNVVPRLLDAIASGTVLVMLDGDLFDDFLQPDQHYLKLSRDLSNLDQVLDRLVDPPFVEALAARAYRDIVVERGSLRRLVTDFDDYLSRRLPRGGRVAVRGAPAGPAAVTPVAVGAGSTLDGGREGTDHV